MRTMEDLQAIRETLTLCVKHTCVEGDEPGSAAKQTMKIHNLNHAQILAVRRFRKLARIVGEKRFLVLFDELPNCKTVGDIADFFGVSTETIMERDK